MSTMTPDRLREPYVGHGADGARRSAEVCRTEADSLDKVRDASRIVDLLDQAAHFDAQAARLEAARVFTATVKPRDHERITYTGLDADEHQTLLALFLRDPLTVVHSYSSTP
jgi:hypothetical protein